MKILIVDAHTALTAGLASLIKNKWNDAEIHFAQRIEDVTRHTHNGFHLALLNPHLIGIAPYEIAREIKRYSQNRYKVAFLLDRPHAETARAAMDQRMDGIILKSDSPEELYRAIKVIMNGQTNVPPSLAQMLYQPLRDDSTLSNLTPREVIALTLLAQGMTQKQIADFMHVSIKTAETHRNNLGRKLGQPNRAQLFALALKHGLVSQEQLEIAA
jgi:two-component system response regulator NreC